MWGNLHRTKDDPGTDQRRSTLGIVEDTTSEVQSVRVKLMSERNTKRKRKDLRMERK